MTQPPETRGAGRSRRAIQGERRTVTVLFCDVAGSTAMAEQLDPEEWAEIMNDAFQYLTGPIERYEGTVARLMGDAILAFFGAPVAHEDDPQRAVLAGLDIVQGVGAFREEIAREYGLDFNVRVGINTGPVVVGDVGSDFAGEYTAMGDAVNLASRMEQSAQPGTVQVAGNTYGLIEPLFDFEPLPPIEVKGKDEPVPAFRVKGPKAEPGRVRGIEGLSAPLVGRGGEMETLRRVVSELREGRGQIVCMIGEPGLGKSRLIDELRAEWQGADSGHAPWIESRGISFDTSRPYGQFQQRGQQLFGVGEDDSQDVVMEKLSRSPEGYPQDLHVVVRRAFEILLAISSESEGPQLEGEALKRELFDAVTSIWRRLASDGPTVMVFDDMHWVDPASAELLRHLFQLTDEVPILFLCATRPERQSPAWQVKQLAETDYPHRYTELALSPLSGDESDSLVSSLLTISDLPARLRRMILEKTDGNPFFVEEVVRTLIDSGAVVRDESGAHWRAATRVEEIDIPENVQTLITSRFDRLESEARSTLQMASVIGRSFYYKVLKLVSETASQLDRQLSTLQRVDLIREAARVPELEYMFGHELTRDAAYNSILRRRCRQFHRRVGEAIEELFTDRVEEQASRLAHHFDEGRDFEKALKYYTLAADAAARLYANVEASTQYERAIALARQTSASNHHLIHLYTGNGAALQLLGRHDEAIANYEELEALARERGDRALEIAALLPLATVFSTYTTRFDPVKGEAVSKQALALAGELDDRQAEAKALWNMMLVETFSGVDPVTAIDHGERSLALARDHNLSEQLAYTLNDISRAYSVAGRNADAWSALQESRALWRDLGNMPMLADNLQASASIYFVRGDFDRAVSLAEEALDVSRSIANLWGQAGSLFAAGPALLERGDVSRSINGMEEATSLSEEGGFAASGFIRPIVAWIYGDLGHWSRGLEITSDGLERLDTSENQVEEALVRRMLLVVSAYLHMLSGDRAEAEHYLAESEEPGSDSSLELAMEVTGMSAVFSTLIKEGVRLAWGDFAGVLATAEHELGRMRAKEIRCYLPNVLRTRAEALRGLGRTDEAFSALAEARAEAERQGSRRGLWRVLVNLAELEEERGNAAEAASLRREARGPIDYIADHADVPGLREAFTSIPRVRAVLDATQG